MKLSDLRLDPRTAVAIVMGAFAVFFFFDKRYTHSPIHQADLTHMEAEMIRRDNLLDATRNAQVLKYYNDVQKERPLTEAEILRLDLVQREISRLHNKMVSDP